MRGSTIARTTALAKRERLQNKRAARNTITYAVVQFQFNHGIVRVQHVGIAFQKFQLEKATSRQRPKKRLNQRKYNTTKWITSTQTVNMYRIKLVKH